MKETLPVVSRSHGIIYICVSVCAQVAELMYFNQDSVILSLSDKSLRLVDQFIYARSNISSTESNVNINTKKAWLLTA